MTDETVTDEYKDILIKEIKAKNNRCVYISKVHFENAQVKTSLWCELEIKHKEDKFVIYSFIYKTDDDLELLVKEIEEYINSSSEEEQLDDDYFYLKLKFIANKYRETKALLTYNVKELS